MKKTPKTTLAADHARKQAVIYARVSSKEQEKEGFSIPAQMKLLKEYAAAAILILAGSAAFVRVRLIESGWMWTVSNW
jgi:predicted site-specific integrase-resolvase